MTLSIILAVAGLVVGGVVGYFGVNASMRGKVASKLKDAEDQGEALKRNKLLEAKEKFLNMKAEFEKEVAERNSKIQQSENRAQQIENRAQQKEQQVNQKQKELDRKNTEVDAIRENLEKQLTLVDAKQVELDKLQVEATEKLSAIAGLSVEEAKTQLIDSIKDEAKTEAMAYVNEMMEDAKLTANKEAKRIIVQTIQRVATETAIENSVTVFNIESGEIRKDINNPGSFFMKIGERAFTDSCFISNIQSISDSSSDGELISVLTDSYDDKATYSKIHKELTQRHLQIVSDKRKSTASGSLMEFNVINNIDYNLILQV